MYWVNRHSYSPTKNWHSLILNNLLKITFNAIHYLVLSPSPILGLISCLPGNAT